MAKMFGQGMAGRGRILFCHGRPHGRQLGSRQVQSLEELLLAQAWTGYGQIGGGEGGG